MALAPTPAGDEVQPHTLAFHRALVELIRVYQFRDRERICCHDISVTQCYALDSLAQRGAQTLNELSAELYLDKSTASRVVDALEAKGYAERRTNPASRRSVLVSATRAGRALHARIERDILLAEQRLLEDFPPTVRDRMTELIRSLAQAAASRVDTRGGGCCSIAPTNTHETRSNTP
jgi:MarR family transcriptional regulator, 2-MHQ and catechol-resistance regulon repressor